MVEVGQTSQVGYEMKSHRLTSLDVAAPGVPTWPHDHILRMRSKLTELILEGRRITNVGLPLRGLLDRRTHLISE